MSRERLLRAVQRRHEPGAVAASQRALHAELRRRSARLAAPDLARLSPADLELLFDELDARFLDGALRPSLGRAPLTLRVSGRMTRAGGRTTATGRRRRDGTLAARTFDIAVSAPLLHGTFDGEAREVSVAGRPCADRLEALQRIFEHELVHLAELVLWGTSRCAAGRFQAIARGLFDHRAHTHALVTPRERAATRHGVRVGGLVSFEFRGETLRGRVNRVTRRATVLVEDQDGASYEDGRRYRKVYVPLDRLRPDSELGSNHSPSRSD